MKSVLRRLWYSVFKEPPRIWLETKIGQTLLLLAPPKIREKLIQQALNTTARGGGLMIVCLSRAIDKTYYLLPDIEKKRFQRRQIWASTPGKLWHENFAKALSPEDRIRSRSKVVAQLREFLTENQSYRTICEVGTGNGVFLDYMAEELPFVEKFIGIDLNPEQIEENKSTARHKNINFHCIEVQDWINQNPKQDAVIFVFVGTLVYFPQTELEALMQLLKRAFSNVGIAIMEMVNDDLDLAHDENSVPRGGLMFSHNYPKIFSKHGFQTFRKEAVRHKRKPQQDLVMLAFAHHECHPK